MKNKLIYLIATLFSILLTGSIKAQTSSPSAEEAVQWLNRTLRENIGQVLGTTDNTPYFGNGRREVWESKTVWYNFSVSFDINAGLAVSNSWSSINMTLGRRKDNHNESYYSGEGWRQANSEDLIVCRFRDLTNPNGRYTANLNYPCIAIRLKTGKIVEVMPLPREQEYHQRVLKAVRHLHSLSKSVKDPF